MTRALRDDDFTLEGELLDTARDAAWFFAIDVMGDMGDLSFEADVVVRMNDACRVLASLGSVSPWGPRPATPARSVVVGEFLTGELRKVAVYHLESVTENMGPEDWMGTDAPDGPLAVVGQATRLSRLIAYIDKHTADGEPANGESPANRDPEEVTA